MEAKKVSITPEELFVLGKILKAQYIDYAYVAAVQNIGSSYDLFVKEATASLVAKELLEEDFSGNVQPRDGISTLFEPVFYGKTETTLDVCSIVEPIRIETMKFHYLDDRITKIVGIDDVLEAELITQRDIESIIVSDILPEQTNTDEESVSEFDRNNVSKYVVAKSNHISESSCVEIYMQSNGRMYKEQADGSIINLKSQEFIEEISQVLLGVK